MDAREADERYMRFALELARLGQGNTSPNPMVGAVIVKDNEIIGRGYHERAGAPHAEVIALREAGSEARDAALYVNLEPCSHYGRTPPCVDAIISAGIKKVVVAMEDPNPLVSGRGVGRLLEAGIDVGAGVLEAEARRLNEVFIKYITTKTPFLIVKTAMTLDGKIAVSSGDSRWITGETSRSFVHKLRSMSDGIMVGIETVLQDDPMLNVRLGGSGKQEWIEEAAAVGLIGAGTEKLGLAASSEDGLFKNPKRIIVDSRGRLPLDSRIVKSAGEIETFLATTELAPQSKLADLQAAGVECIVLPSKDGHVDLSLLMGYLGEKEICQLLVEGGGTLNFSLLSAGLIDKVYCFVAPKIFGGKEARTPMEGAGVQTPDEAWIVEDMEITQFDRDLLITGYPVRG